MILEQYCSRVYYRARHLFGLSETNGAVAKVIHTVPLPQESISQDGQGADGLREVHTHEGTHAGALNLQSVVVRGDGELVAAQTKSEVGQGRTLLAVNIVLAQPVLGGTDLLVPVIIKLAYIHMEYCCFETYRSSARVEGRAMREVPVSRMTPVLSSSATLSPRAMESKSTSQ